MPRRQKRPDQTRSGAPAGSSAAGAPDLDSAWESIEWNRFSRSARVHGRQVRYVDIGTGPAVVLIHGQGGSWQWWLRVLPCIATEVRAIAVDLAGFGESDPVSSGDVFDEQIATVVGLLDHLNLKSATVVGHSMGGLVALKVACDHPGRVTGLMLVDAGSATIGPVRLQMLLMAFRLFDKVFSFPAIPRVIARREIWRSLFFALATAHPRSVTEPLATAILPQMAAPGFLANAVAAATALTRVCPQDVIHPSLVVWGRQDRIVPLASGRKLASTIPGAQLVVLDEVGHCAMIEKPHETSALIVDFALNQTIDAHDSLSSQSTENSDRGCTRQSDGDTSERRFRFRRGAFDGESTPIGRNHDGSQRIVERPGELGA